MNVMANFKCRWKSLKWHTLAFSWNNMLLTTRGSKTWVMLSYGTGSIKQLIRKVSCSTSAVYMLDSSRWPRQHNVQPMKWWTRQVLLCHVYRLDVHRVWALIDTLVNVYKAVILDPECLNASLSDAVWYIDWFWLIFISLEYTRSTIIIYRAIYTRKTSLNAHNIYY